MTQAVKDAAKFLKSTLLLPSTTFPPRPRPEDLARYLPRCTDDLYSWQRRERPATNTFRLHDGPPYANGDLHVGHALNKILKDIICRSRLAQGKRVDYVPGWDCHGLPIELKALEKHGWKRGYGVDSLTIRKAAKEFAQATVQKQMDEFRSWAVMSDWDAHWETMQKDFEVRQLDVFKAMVDKGLIYRQRKPVYWSPSSRTALAEAELEYKDDHISTAAYVKFPLNNPSFTSSPVYALIWTTTPWTLPANQAIALNTSMEYSLVSTQHGLLVLARARLDILTEVLGDFTVVQDLVPVNELLALSYNGLPEFGLQATNRPFIAADFVSAESGTGLVHCAPGHGMEDYQALQALIKTGKVQVKAPLDAEGCFDDDASPLNTALLAGKNVLTDGNATILAMLKNSAMLVHHHKYSHKYPIDWRTKEPIIIRATAQWFADLSPIRDDALSAIEATNFVPTSGKNRLRSFVENRSEWCISRQRSWGVPIPALHHRKTGEAVLSSTTLQHIISLIKVRGTDAWWSDAEDCPDWMPPGFDPLEYRRDTDTMDVWFDSGSSWTLMTGPEKQTEPPADVYIEGTDQHRGWFQSSLLTNVAYQKATGSEVQPSAPFKNLVTHGFTLDAKGKKMSKSEGNVISPDQIMAGFHQDKAPQTSKATKKGREFHPLGPDALRLWVASSDWTRDVVVSETVVKTVHTALDKYRVTFKLLLGLLKDFDPTKVTPYENVEMVDRIALLQLHNAWQIVRQAYANLEFHQAVTAINRWVVADLSGFYFEAIKDVCYCESSQSPRRLSACTALHQIFIHLQQMLSPLCPLLVEESWEHASDVHKASSEYPLKRIWEESPSQWKNTELEEALPLIMAVNSSVKAAQESARSDKLLGQSLASEVRIFTQPESGAAEVAVTTWEEILVVSKVQVFELDGFADGASREHGSEAHSWARSRDVLDVNECKVGVAVVTSPSMGKCSRCWRYMAGPAKEEELALCERCSDVVDTFRAQPHD